MGRKESGLFFDAGLDRANQLETITENRACAHVNRERVGRVLVRFGRRSPELGRGLLRARPNSDRCRFDERQVVGSEFVVSCRNTPTLLDLKNRSIRFRAR
jgi:hypothetical protein